MPNIVMIAFDDLNDWSSALGGYAGQVYTPNFDRLAANGATFANAFSTTPSCNPARSSVLSGMGPLTTGVIGNDELLFDQVDPSMTLPAQLTAAGWTTATAGKVFHKLPVDVAAEIYTHVLAGPGLPEGNGPRPTEVTPTGATQRIGVYTGKLEDLDDIKNTNAAIDFLDTYRPAADGRGLFLSVGITRPHEPHIAPQEFFDLYPIEDIVLPAAWPDDLNDIPGFADYFVDTAGFDRTRLAEEFPAFVQAYLAAVSFADWMLGRVLDAIENSAIADDTVIALWSDHGFHLGEKQHVGKFTLWDEAARSHLIISAPGGEATEGRKLQTPVSMLDLYPTLLDYAGVAIPDWTEGESLRGLIETNDGEPLRGHAVTSIAGSHSIRTASWRYTRYEDGTEELYDLKRDPEAFVNLADDPAAAARKSALAARLEAQLETQPFLQNRGAAPAVLDASSTGERVLVAGNPGDTLVGGAGNNVYQVRASTVTVSESREGGHDIVNTAVSFTLPNHVEELRYTGGSSEDTSPVLVGNALGNLIRIGAGRGALFGGAGDDTLSTEDGSDTFSGGAGDDLLESLNGEDVFDGGAGNDTMRGGGGDDVYRLSAGIDAIIERIDGGFDTLDVAAWGGLDAVRVIERFVGARLAALEFEQVGGTARATVDAVGGVVPIEALRDDGAIRLLVAGTVSGGDAAERLLGSAGDDTLRGLDGDDTLAGGAGDDVLDGGKGRNTASYATATAAVQVSLGEAAGAAQDTGGAGTDRLDGFDNLVGSGFDDALAGQAKANRLDGGAGNDILSGFGGDDTLVGGLGADTLRGGGGADRFVFGPDDIGAARDRVLDFERGDAIDLTAIDADPGTGRREPLRFQPDARPGRTDITVRFENGDTVVEIAAGDGIVLVLNGTVALTAQDFLL